MNKKVLIYGGSFNPPHLGHEHILKNAMESIQPDLTLVLPSAVPPHKDPAAVALHLRALMCRTFQSIDKSVKISEIERAGKHDKSYTLKTLRRLKKKYKNCQFFLLIGSDMLLSFEKWHRFRRILPLVTLVAASRETDDLAALKNKATFLEKMGGKVILLNGNPLPMSSTAIRKKMKENQPITGMVSDTVLDVIKKYSIYQ